MCQKQQKMLGLGTPHRLGRLKHACEDAEHAAGERAQAVVKSPPNPFEHLRIKAPGNLRVRIGYLCRRETWPNRQFWNRNLAGRPETRNLGKREGRWGGIRRPAPLCSG